MNDDLISRQAAIDTPERFIKDCNPEHFVGHQKFIEYMDDAEIGSFGNWQFANGFNLGLIAAEVAIQELPSVQPERRFDEWCTDCKEYDQERHCCPRFNHVIRTTLQEVQPERKKGKWVHGKEIAREYLAGRITYIEYKDYHCSECGYTVEDIRWNVDGELVDRYCTACGAQMEVEK